MQKALPYEVVVNNSARCVVVWWKKRLPLETARDCFGKELSLNYRRELGLNLAQILYMKVNNPVDLIGLFKKVWQVLFDNDINIAYIMVAPKDRKLYQRLKFEDSIFGETKWDLIENLPAYCMELNVSNIKYKSMMSPNYFKRSEMNIIKGLL